LENRNLGAIDRDYVNSTTNIVLAVSAASFLISTYFYDKKKKGKVSTLKEECPLT
jgi:hypothetical protein